MKFSNWMTLDELAAKWESDPESLLAEYRQRPYFDVAQDIYELRQDMAITQAELAERAETHQSRVSKLESADLDFKLSTLAKIAEALQAHVHISVVKNLDAALGAYRPLLTIKASSERPDARPEINVNATLEPSPSLAPH
jgi:transcriptional regulator with XRE-family HTH domain